jgi:hypothetical protein
MVLAKTHQLDCQSASVSTAALSVTISESAIRSASTGLLRGPVGNSWSDRIGQAFALF